MPRHDGTTRKQSKGQRARRRRLGTQKWQDLRENPNDGRTRGKTRGGRNR